MTETGYQMNLGSYQLMAKLASGGMAEVFLAKAAGPRGFAKKLVVKRILPHLAEDASFIEMFFAEARLVAQLDHPNIVQIFDFGEADGAYFLSMEYVDGLNLRALIKRVQAAGERLPVALCAKIISAACEGLAYAHEFMDPETQTPLRLVHRDISPDNILVSTHGAVKLADFGIAKAANQVHRTQTGVVKGKVAYMPPEQIQGKPLDARTDIYALGVVLYELLTGRRPFEAEHETALMLAILHEDPVPVTKYREEVPESVQRILTRALAKDRDARYASCRELQLSLERYLRTCEEPVGPVDISRWVTRFASPGMDAAKTPSAKLLLETPRGQSLAAPENTPAASPSRERMRMGSETLPADVLADSTRTDPAQPQVSRKRSLRWVAAGGTGAALLLLVGVALWRSGSSAPEAQVPIAPPSAPVAGVGGVTPAALPEPSPNPQGQEAPATAEAATGTSLPSETARSPQANEPKAPSPQPVPPVGVETDPRKPVVQAPAVLHVESNVEGAVRLLRSKAVKQLGRTPLDVKDLPPGRVVLEVSDKQQGFSKQQTVVLKSGDNKVRFDIGKGRLSVFVRPFATLYLDGKKVDVTPLPGPLEVYEGHHAIRLVNEKLGKDVTVDYVVKAGANQTYTADLTKD